MTVKDLKRKLDLITEDCQDFEIYIDVGDLNPVSLEKVFINAVGEVYLSSVSSDKDIEDNKTQDKLKLEDLKIGDTFKYNLDNVGIFKVIGRQDENWISTKKIQSGRITGDFPWTEVYPIKVSK